MRSTSISATLNTGNSARPSALIPALTCTIFVLLIAAITFFGSATAPGVQAGSVHEGRSAGAGTGFASKTKLDQHFGKHAKEFGEITLDEYLRRAQELRDCPASCRVLEGVRKDRVITRFDRSSGAFIAFDADFTIRTFFKPNDGEAYFHRQLK